MQLFSGNARRRCARRTLAAMAASVGLVLCVAEFAAAQMCGRGPGGGTGTGTGAATAGLGFEALQAPQWLVYMQQMEAEALRQRALQMMAAARQKGAPSAGARTGPCGGEPEPAERAPTVRNTGDRFASQRAAARLRQEVIAARIANREAELQRRRDRAAAGR